MKLRKSHKQRESNETAPSRSKDKTVRFWTKVIETGATNGDAGYKGKLDDAWYFKGETLYELQKYEEALKCFDKALEIEPDSFHVLHHKAWIFENWKMYDRAIECYESTIKVCDDTVKRFGKAIGVPFHYVNACHRKGVVLSNLGKYDEAIKCYDKAIEVKVERGHGDRIKRKPSEFVIHWCEKGVALAKLGKYDEAIACFDKAIKIQPRNAYAWYSKGSVLSKMDNAKAAKKCFDKARKLGYKI